MKTDSIIEQFFYNTSLIHQHMGADLVKLGGLLRCTVCGQESEPLTADNIASYLKSGWPRHCEKGMRWITQKELDQESSPNE